MSERVSSVFEITDRGRGSQELIFMKLAGFFLGDFIYLLKFYLYHFRHNFESYFIRIFFFFFVFSCVKRDLNMEI